MAGMERLNKLLAHAGIGSRRQCDELIRAGRVRVDDQPVDDLGTKVEPDAPRVGVEKTYLVQVQGTPAPAELRQLLRGVWLSDGKVRAQRIKRLKRQRDSTWLRIVLSEGKNREVRRMLAKLGHKVLSLKRVAIGPVVLDRL